MKKRYFYRPENVASTIAIIREDGLMDFIFADGDYYRDFVLSANYPEKYGFIEITKAQAEEYLVKWSLFTQLSEML